MSAEESIFSPSSVMERIKSPLVMFLLSMFPINQLLLRLYLPH
jgi:hypothetical protein